MWLPVLWTLHHSCPAKAWVKCLAGRWHCLSYWLLIFQPESSPPQHQLKPESTESLNIVNHKAMQKRTNKNKKLLNRIHIFIKYLFHYWVKTKERTFCRSLKCMGAHDKTTTTHYIYICTSVLYHQFSCLSNRRFGFKNEQKLWREKNLFKPLSFPSISISLQHRAIIEKKSHLSTKIIKCVKTCKLAKILSTACCTDLKVLS